MAELLTEKEFAAYLQAALQGSRESKERDGPLTWSFREYFAYALHDALGEIDNVDGRREAWHIMYAVHCILPNESFDQYIECGYDAWVTITEDVAPAGAVRE